MLTVHIKRMSSLIIDFCSDDFLFAYLFFITFYLSRKFDAPLGQRFSLHCQNLQILQFMLPTNAIRPVCCDTAVSLVI